MAWVYSVAHHKFYRINKERKTVCSLPAGIGEGEINRLNQVLNGVSSTNYNAKLAKNIDLFGKLAKCVTKDSYRETGTKPALYAGAPGYKDDPTKEQVKNRGPLPRGIYFITAMRDGENTGPDTIYLEPHASNPMYNRSLFRIHGDKSGAAAGTASSGCIVANLDVRRAIWNSEDKQIINRGLLINENN